MKKKIAFLFLLAAISAVASPGRAAGTAAQAPGALAAPGQMAAADKDLLELLPRSTIAVLVLDFKRLLAIDAVAKALEGPEFKKLSDEIVKMSGVDLKKDITYLGWGVPAAAVAGRLSAPASPAAIKGMAMVIGLRSDKTRLQGLVKEKVPGLKEEVHNGVSVFMPGGLDEPSAATPAVLADVAKMQFAFLDDAHIVLGDEVGIRDVIDVHQKRAGSLAQVPEMAAFMSRVDKSGVAWSAVSYPPEQAKMIADANPLFKGIEGFKGMITAIDDKDSTLVVDVRTLGGTKEQNAAFATNLDGIKAVGALYAAKEPALAELVNGVAITSGEDYTRLTVTVTHETLGKLMLLTEPEAGGLGPAAEGEAVDWQALLKKAEDLGREGDLDRAIAAGEQALRRAELELGPDHPDLAKVLDKIADLYREDGLLQEAEPLWIRSLAIREKALGPDHPDVAEGLNGLAAYYEKLGRDAEAVTFYDRLLAVREKSLGPEHPQVATVLDTLARLHYYQRQEAQAEPLWRRSLAIREKALGPYHSDVAANLHDLALVLQVQGKYAEAEPLWRRLLAVQEKSLGPDHADMARTLGLLAVLCRATQRQKEAEALEARATRIQSIKR